MTKRLTREQAAIISAYTGISVGPFSDTHGYAEGVLGRPIFTHEFASAALIKELRDVARADFIVIAYEETK